MDREVLMETNDENSAPDQVRSSNAIHEVSEVAFIECVKGITGAQQKVSGILSESRVTRQVRNEIENELNRMSKEVERILVEVQSRPKVPAGLVGVIVEILSQRGIGTEAEWRDYVRTMERDGEVISDLCEMLNTDTLQLKEAVAELQQQARMGVGRTTGQNEGQQPLFDWKDIARGLEGVFEADASNVARSGGCRTLGEELPVLIDTGSMISIVPIEVLARAQDRGVDVDALKLVD
ncbi:hypothetical protein ANCCAN_23186, partial [Ancylostoma caninum]